MKAKITIRTIEITCPYCEATINDPEYGSQFWEVNSELPEAVTCGDCGKESKLPVSVTRG